MWASRITAVGGDTEIATFECPVCDVSGEKLKLSDIRVPRWTADRLVHCQVSPTNYGIGDWETFALPPKGAAMCHRCTEIQLAISKGRKLAESESDSGVSRQARAFVEVLKIELAALQVQPDHRA